MATPTLIEKVLLLKSAPIFSSLDLEMILPISDKLGPLTFKAGRPIFTAGEEGTHVYLVAEGEVVLSDVDGNELGTRGQGELFGEESLLSGRPRGYTATSGGAILLLALSKANFLATLEECPAVAIALLEAYASQIQQRS